ncbi:hypothetical protein BOTNAR_0290g00090 [Botryotinia narcissicola]|uniref:Uncharacterized protein n=1 Tax=Botryotinia narcissicola TaxID=278944 RepID=A0A4Z1IAG7_9HELO|nr:hypothetical protein BOTNAR_0290g00090 [Botryotinia narcissicola]
MTSHNQIFQAQCFFDPHIDIVESRAQNTQDRAVNKGIAVVEHEFVEFAVVGFEVDEDFGVDDVVGGCIAGHFVYLLFGRGEMIVDVGVGVRSWEDIFARLWLMATAMTILGFMKDSLTNEDYRMKI